MIEADAFVLAGDRSGIRWHVTRRICFWLVEMERDGRKVVTSSLGHRPEQGDDALRTLERRHFNE